MLLTKVKVLKNKYFRNGSAELLGFCALIGVAVGAVALIAKLGGSLNGIIENVINVVNGIVI